MNREHRNLLLEGQLVLISPYDPNAGFNVGNAMQRNKLIYALADASLVVSSDINKGGTWTGAIEQLEKLKFVPVYVRSTGEASVGLDALRKKGAIPWPNPQDVDSFDSVFDVDMPSPAESQQSGLSLFSNDESPDVQSVAPTSESLPLVKSDNDVLSEATNSASQTESTPAETLFAAVRNAIRNMLNTPMKDAEIAAALDVSSAQAKIWLQRLLDEGVIEKQKKPAGYVVKQNRLFE
jgi:predicted Rossmann fold nucleotide-binding protein DprA/Smf involved in DNA uptake